MTSNDAVVHSINVAFDFVERPRDEELVREPEDLDAREALARFHGKRSGDVDDLVKIGVTSAEDLYQLTPQAIRYFLPCYLRYIAKDRPYWEFGIVIGLVNFLDKKNGISCGVIYPKFTAEQRACVRKVLLLMQQSPGRYDLGESDDSLRRKIEELIASQDWNGPEGNSPENGGRP